jgi:hypothetical protein
MSERPRAAGVGTRDLSELRDFIRGRRAALYGFMENGAALELDGDILRVIPRNDIYIRDLSDNRALIAELATEFFGRPIKAQPLGVAVVASNGGAQARPTAKAAPAALSGPTRPLQPDRKEIARAIARICRPGAVYELRALNTTRATVSGYYDDFDKMAEDAWKLSGDVFKASGVYLTLNPGKPELLARAHNRLESYARNTTADAHIIRRYWFPLDFDPRRVDGISSTDFEHQAALECARKVRHWLTTLGWPAPIFADSGNGAHLLYKIDLDNDAESAALLKRILKTIDQRFTDATVLVDKKVFNASRIWKLYGSIAKKGDDMPDRPHRRAFVIETPEASL